MPKHSPRRNKATLYDLFHKDPFAGKGYAKGTEDVPRTLSNFFKLSWRHISHIMSVNLAFLVANFPVILLLLAFSGLLSDSISSPASSMLPILLGQIQSSVDPVSAALFGIHGIQGSLSVMTTATKIVYGFGALIVITWGPANVGTTYILRNLIKGDPIFFRHDFFYAIKRNLRQCFIMGFLDLLFCTVFVYSTVFHFFNMSLGMIGSMIFYASLLITIVYFIMRFYIYIVLITFDLSIFKILKNAFIFVSLGLKRNIMAALGIFALLLLDYFLLAIIMPLGLILPFVLLYGYGGYMAAYAAWPKIKQYMIDPYPQDQVEQEAPIFADDVSPKN
ncbi:MAG: hypothetical protein IKB34_01005 [Clostridia bacterium]|nr:hypothetical protein [Clostridia bacterium]